MGLFARRWGLEYGEDDVASVGSGIGIDGVQIMAFILCAHTYTHPVEDPTLTDRF